MTYKKTRYILSTFFLVGAIVFLGIMSYAGMLYLTGSIPLSIASCFLAILIEGEIYRQNILSAMGMILHFGDFVRRDSYSNALKKLALDNDLREQTPFLKDYYIEFKKLEKHDKHPKKMTEADRRALERTEKRVRAMEDFFAGYLDNKQHDDSDFAKQISGQLDTLFDVLSQHDNAELITDKTHAQAVLQANIRRELFWLRWVSMPITLIGGAMALLVTTSQLSAVLAPLMSALAPYGLVVTPTLFLAVIWPLAGLAAVGTMLITYNTFVDIIHYKTWQQHLNSLVTKIKASGWVGRALYGFGTIFLLGLAVAATLAMIGTWTTAAQEGLLLLPFLAVITARAKNVLVVVGIAAQGLAHFIFDYASSLESFAMLTAELKPEGLPEPLHAEFKQRSYAGQVWMKLAFAAGETYKKWSALNAWEKLNLFTWINLLIEYSFRFALFLGHLISIGVTADRVDGWPPIVPTLITSAQEASTDIPYVFGGTCSHHHSDLAGSFLYYALSPIKLLAVAWNGICSGLFRGKQGFSDYYYQEFPLHKLKKSKQNGVEALSPAWQRYEIAKMLEQEQQRLLAAGAAEAKVSIFASALGKLKKIPLAKGIEAAGERGPLVASDGNAEAGAAIALAFEAPQDQQAVMKQGVSVSPQILFSTEDRKKLAEHRSWSFWSAKTRSLAAVEELDEAYPLLAPISAQ